MSKYRIKKATGRYGGVTFTAQARFLGLWFDMSVPLPSFGLANDHVVAALCDEDRKGAGGGVCYIEPDLSDLQQ